MFVYDITNEESFRSFHQWSSDIEKVSSLAQEELKEALVNT